MKENETQHKSVLLGESVAALVQDVEGFYIDGTFGRGGHSSAVLARLAPAAQLLGFDKDPEAVAAGEALAAQDSRFGIVAGSFANMLEEVKRRGMLGKVSGILLDLGVSSPQLDQADRGFSFVRDGKLDMRMDTTSGISAADWVNTAEAEDIAHVLKVYGEERYARRIAGAIVKAREEQRIETTLQLAEIVKQAHPRWEKNKHPATRSFQGIRIFINSELEDLEKVLQQSAEVLAPGGRLVVISFHSLEDRIVKQFMRKAGKEQDDDLPSYIPVQQKDLGKPLFKTIGKALKPAESELDENWRARSAVMRVAEKAA